MREIKFRAWDVNDEAMIMNPLGFPELYPTSELMQYTGLKDKNGVEIYEGDIVKYSGHYFGDHWEKESVGAVEWDAETAAYPWKLTDTGFVDGPDWCEVIGNIHERPELLTGRKGAA